MPLAPGPRRNCYTICRPLVVRGPSVSACPPGGLGGVRGSLLFDLRPPHYRDVLRYPGSMSPPRAILTALRLLRSSSMSCFVLLPVLRTTGPARQPLVALSFGSQPRRPTRLCSGLEPHCRTSRCARPQPTPSPRYHCPAPLLDPTNCRYCSLRQLRSCLRRPLNTAGHPVRSPVPSPSCTNPGSGTPPPHRPAPANCTRGSCCPAVRICQALLTAWLREKQ